MTTSRGGRPRALRPNVSWYGLQPWWQVWLEAGARTEHGTDFRLDLQLDRIIYRLPVEVPGRRAPVEVRIEFHQRPPYDCYGLPPEEYPRVFAAPDVTSPHRMPTDHALCLYYPKSPPGQRWRPTNGLLSLIDLTRDHVFLEDYWRTTGGERGGIWLGAEASHGFPQAA